MPDMKNTVFALVSAAIFMDMLVYSLVIPVLPSYSLGLGAGTVAIGVIFGSFSVSLLIFSIPFGVVSDRIGRRQFMVLGMLTLAATNVIFALSGNIYVLILARLVQGMSGAATWSAGLAMLADAFEPGERGRRLGFALSAMAAGTLAGPTIGGILYDNLGYAPTFILPAVPACLVGLAFLVVKEPAVAPGHVPLRDRLAPFLERPHTSAAIAVAVIVGAASFGLLEPYMPVYLFRSFAATPTAIGLTFGAMALLSIVVQPIVGRLYDTHGGRLLLTAGFIGSAMVVAGTMLMPSLYSTAAVFALLGATMGFALTPVLPLLSDLYGPKANTKGFVYGVYNTLFSIGLAIGPFLGGVLVAAYTLRVTLLGQAFLLALTGILAYVALKGTKARDKAQKRR